MAVTQPAVAQPAESPEIEHAAKDIARRVGPAVVAVLETRDADAAAESFRDRYWRERGGPPDRRRDDGSRDGSFSSGVLIQPPASLQAQNPWLLTSSGALPPDATSARVVLADGRELSARVLGRDVPLDLALLALDTSEHLPTPVTLAPPGSGRLGAIVFSLGNPFQSITRDRIAAVGRGTISGRYPMPPAPLTRGRYRGHALETDAPVNPGSWGGPLVDHAGRLVGMITSSYVRQRRLPVAVPANLIRLALPLLARGVSVTAWLGITVVEVPGTGLLVDAVAEGSPAQRAGIQVGWRLQRLAGNPARFLDEIEAALASIIPFTQTQVELLTATEEPRTLELTPSVLDDQGQQITAPPVAPELSEPPASALTAWERVHRQAAAAVDAAIVAVIPNRGGTRAALTGIVVDGSGLILTSLHGLGNLPGSPAYAALAGLSGACSSPHMSRPVVAHVVNATGDEADARLLGIDRHRDLALLQVQGLDLKPPYWKDGSSLRVGQLVLAVGRDGSSFEPLVNSGIISAVGRFNGRAIQHDARVNRANLGGALVSLDGRVIGLLTHLSPRPGLNSGVGFAVPVWKFRPLLGALRRGGEIKPPPPPWLGVQVGSDGKPGIPVEKVIPDSPAALAGILPGDRILAFQRRPLASRRDLARALSEHKAGDEVILRILSGEEVRITKVELFRRPDSALLQPGGPRGDG